MQAVSFVNNVTFSLIKTGDYNWTTTMLVGSKVHFQLQIAFPFGTTDLQVELFTPVNDTVIMTLCSPQITFIGPNIQYSILNATVELDLVPNTFYVSLSLYCKPPAALCSVEYTPDLFTAFNCRPIVCCFVWLYNYLFLLSFALSLSEQSLSLASLRSSESCNK